MQLTRAGGKGKKNKLEKEVARVKVNGINGRGKSWNEMNWWGVSPSGSVCNVQDEEG